MRAVGAVPVRVDAPLERRVDALSPREREFYGYCLSRAGGTTAEFMAEACLDQAYQLAPPGATLRKYRGPMIAAAVFGVGVLIVARTRR